MFALLICAYIIFATNWVAGSNLSKQITDHYFNGEKVSPIISEIVNYTITIARIIANLLAAYKITPEEGSDICLILFMFFIFCNF